MAEPDSTNVTAELLRRQAENQIRVAQATEQAAQYSMHNARYVLWAVIVLMLSSLANLGVALVTLYVITGAGDSGASP
jgi:hypothetical protein